MNVSGTRVGRPASRQVAGALAALERLLPFARFALVPAAAVVGMFVVALDTGPLAWDFRNELYPQTKDLLSGTNPYPGALWPPLAAVVAMPFTVLPSGIPLQKFSASDSSRNARPL